MNNLIHYSVILFYPVCGADKPNQETTQIGANVTCAFCTKVIENIKGLERQNRYTERILDHGYLRFVEDWGRGDVGQAEAGIIEAARQSTQASFRGWEDKPCERCSLEKTAGLEDDGGSRCPDCDGKGYLPGDQRLLKFLHSGKPQHATPFEFCGMVIEVQAPTCVVWEWVRHRTHGIEDGENPWDRAFNIMSSRYGVIPTLDYVPVPERCLVTGGKNTQAKAVKGSADITEESARQWLTELSEAYAVCERAYQSGLQRGVPKEIARLALTFGRYWRFRVTANLRNWLAFMTLRADPQAQYEIQCYAHAVGEIIAERFPRTWKLFDEMRNK